MHYLHRRPNVQLIFTTIDIRLQLHFHLAAAHFLKNSNAMNILKTKSADMILTDELRLHIHFLYTPAQILLE